VFCDDPFVLNVWLYAWSYRKIQSTGRQLVAGKEHSEPYFALSYRVPVGNWWQRKSTVDPTLPGATENQ
jgi:hypothetical protein